MSVTVVAISGPSGSGKSSLVNSIVQRLSGATRLHFDDYKEVTKFPEDLTLWVHNGCNPDEFSTPKMVDDLLALCRESHGTDQWIVLEEPFGRNRSALSPLIDYVVCIDIPLDIAFARTVKRAALSVPKDVGVPDLLNSIIGFVDQYLFVGRDTYTIVNKSVMENCDLVVDGTKDVDVLADEIVSFLKNKVQTH